MITFDNLNWVDVSIGAILAVSMVFGLVRGLVREILALTTWILGAWVALTYSGSLSAHLSGWISVPTMARAVVFLALLVGVIVLGHLFMRLLMGWVGKAGLSGLNHVLGGVFGVVRGVLVVGLALWFFTLYCAPEVPVVWQQSQLRPYTTKALDALTALCPQWAETLRHLRG